MACLQEFPEVCKNLKTAKVNSIIALHKLIFEQEGDRGNRKRLRNFMGFNFSENDEQYNNKSTYVDRNLSSADLTSICILLGLNYDVANVKLHILRNLCQGNFLEDTCEEGVNDDDDDSEDDDNYSNNVENTTMKPLSVRSNNHDLETPSHDDDHAYSVNPNNDLPNEESACMPKPTCNAMMPRFALSFRDIEDSIHCFDGTNKIPIEVWVQEFEETASVMCWDDFQKLIFAKKSLKGIAKSFIMSEKGITTWVKLKKALLNEFKLTINSAQIHKKLCEHRMTKGENVNEYFYQMKQIAAQGCIDDNALIQYVIDGIRDLHVNKTILYGANDIREFKEKLRSYEMYVSKQPVANEVRTSDRKLSANTNKTESTTVVKCFNCGGKGHRSADCFYKNKGTKCYSCNKFGHVSKDCKNKTNKDANTNVACVMPTNDEMLKNIQISNIELSALIDTGSKFNLITASVYKRLNEPILEKSNVVLVGFGSKENMSQPLGCIQQTVHIDDETFELKFYVVRDECMDIDVIIGQPIRLQAEITLNPEAISIRKTEIAKIMSIHVEPENEIDIDESVDPIIKQKVYDLVKNYQPDKKKTTNVEMKIILKDETPISTRPRRLPLAEQKIVEEQIEQWLDEGIIENSDSEFSSPIVLVNKKNGSKRLCIDYRKLNKVIVKDRFPLPLIDDQLDRLSEAIIYTTLDLRNGFFHVTVEVGSRKYTTFVSHHGEYQFTKMPFGLSNSPAVFQRFINAIFRELIREGIALSFMDDIIVPAKSEQEAVERLEQVLAVCKDYGLDINFKKCHFLKKRVEFLGHVIENQEVSPSPAKVEAMIKYPVPTNLKQVESFLGLAGYFRKFIPNFSLIAKPLSDLRKNNVKFVMQNGQINAFDMLKNLLAEGPVLKIFNVNHETELHTDASANGYGAVLMQKWPDDGQFHPVYYMSKKTTDQECKYTSYELEILAVIQALKKFRVYLIGIHFKIITDCNAFATTMNKQDLSTRVARWLLLLQEYDYEIEHRSGSQMRHVDALSRQPIMMITEETTLTNGKKAQAIDEHLKPIIEILHQNQTYEDYFLKADVLYKLVNECEKIVIPSALQYTIIKNAHEKGHFALKKTKELISNDYFIPKLDEKIQKCISNCIPCLLINRKKGKLEGVLHPLPKPDTPLHTYHLDFIGPLETTSKFYKHILVIIDAFSKFCWLYPTKTTSAACALAKLQLQNVTFGNPVQLVTDRGSAFTSEEFKNYCESENIKHLVITTGLPRANGQVERLNAVVTAVLAKLAVKEPNKWYKYVEKVQQYINSSFSRSTNFTPFELLMGVKMRLKEDLTLKQTIEEELNIYFDESRDEMRRQAKLQILKTQEENKHSYNLRRKAATRYKEGDYVAIKRTQFGGGLKLKPKYLGPYQVTKVKPNETYDVVTLGASEGPARTTSCAEFMKPWPMQPNPEGSTFGANV